MSSLSPSSSAEKALLYLNHPILTASAEELDLIDEALNDRQSFILKMWSTFQNCISGYIKKGSGLELKQITATFFSAINNPAASDTDKKKTADLLRSTFSNRVAGIARIAESAKEETVTKLFNKFVFKQFLSRFNLSDERAASIFSEINTLLRILPPPTLKESPKPFYSKISALLTSRNIKIFLGTGTAALLTGWGVTLLYPLADPANKDLSNTASLVCTVADKILTWGTCPINYNSTLGQTTLLMKLDCIHDAADRALRALHYYESPQDLLNPTADQSMNQPKADDSVISSYPEKTIQATTTQGPLTGSTSNPESAQIFSKDLIGAGFVGLMTAALAGLRAYRNRLPSKQTEQLDAASPIKRARASASSQEIRPISPSNDYPQQTSQHPSQPTQLTSTQQDKANLPPASSQEIRPISLSTAYSQQTSQDPSQLTQLTARLPPSWNRHLPTHPISPVPIPQSLVLPANSSHQNGTLTSNPISGVALSNRSSRNPSPITGNINPSSTRSSGNLLLTSNRSAPTSNNNSRNPSPKTGSINPSSKRSSGNLSLKSNRSAPTSNLSSRNPSPRTGNIGLSSKPSSGNLLLKSNRSAPTSNLSSRNPSPHNAQRIVVNTRKNRLKDQANAITVTEPSTSQRLLTKPFH